IEKPFEREVYVEYRVKATFVQQYDFKSFPFDVQNLNIVIEDKSLNLTKLVFVPDFEESGLDPQAYVVGWKFTDFKQEKCCPRIP
ncbi:MAG: hypothetical protein ACP5OK_09880, partial [Thermoprotei archaeon]